MSDEHSGLQGALPADPSSEGSLGFWIVYSLIWILISGIFLVSALVGEDSAKSVIAAILAVVIPAAAAGVPVAMNRRRLFRPDRSLPRTVLVQILLGASYAVLGGLFMRLMFGFVPMEWFGDEEADVPVVFFFVNAAFFYLVLAGFLMWTESRARFLESQALAAREAVLRAQAEARAIRAQFNPHFVFNTLHSLMLLVRAEPATAERAIENVAGLIRYGSRLEREERDQVTLDEEMDFARRYLALEELRLEDRLRMSWEVEEGLGGTSVPAFSLQTLLENAVKHGVAPNPEGATVQVSVSRADGGVLLAVQDDGDGTRPELVEDSDGHGLGLLRERVRVLYGEAGSLRWWTGPGEGFRAELRVPAP